MKTFDNKIITKKYIHSVIRTFDPTKIFALYRKVTGCAPSYYRVVDFLEEYAPSIKCYKKACAECKSANYKHDRYRNSIESSIFWKRGAYSFHDTFEEMDKVVKYIREMFSRNIDEYTKVAMKGINHLYFCHPGYGHQDYNKWRSMPIEGNEHFVDKVISFCVRKYKEATGVNYLA